MCQLLMVNRSSYYAWLNQITPSARTLENQKLTEEIKMIFIEHKCRYGSRRIRKALIKEGYQISRRRVGNLMKSQGLCCKTKRRFKHTTDSKHDLPVAPNLLQRNFSPAGPNQAYAGDITYIPTGEQVGYIWLSSSTYFHDRWLAGR
jgi:putative transposase